MVDTEHLTIAALLTKRLKNQPTAIDSMAFEVHEQASDSELYQSSSHSGGRSRMSVKVLKDGYLTA